MSVSVHPPGEGDDRYAAIRQYSLAQILGVWAAAAVPMGILAWIVAPWLRDQLGAPRDPKTVHSAQSAFIIILVLTLVLSYPLGVLSPGPNGCYSRP
jgi:hypothetical protein